MNLYAMLAFGSGASASSALAGRLAAWHDTMVAHERRLRAARSGEVCDDECPHVQAPALWAEALAAYGERAHELSFLRSRATSTARHAPGAGAARSREPEPSVNDRSADPEWGRAARDSRRRLAATASARSRHTTTEAEL